MKNFKKLYLRANLIFFLNICVCTHLYAESPSFNKNILKKEPRNQKALFGVWKSRDLSVPMEITISSLDDESVRGIFKLENREFKFHKSIWVSKIPHEYTYKFIYEIQKTKQGAGRYTFFPHLENPNLMRGIYTNLKGNNENFTLYR